MEIFSMFVNTTSLVIVFVPLFVTCVSLWLSCKTKWNVLLRDLGVPIGLFFSVVGGTGLAVNMTDVEIYGRATAIMLLTVTYGGLVSALGYFSTFKRSSPDRHNNEKTASWMVIT